MISHSSFSNLFLSLGSTLGSRSHHNFSLILQQSFSISRVTLMEPGHTTISSSFFSIIFPSLGSHSGNQVTPRSLTRPSAIFLHLSGHTLGTRSHHDLSLILQQSFSISRVTLWKPGHTMISQSSFSNLFLCLGSHYGNQVTPRSLAHSSALFFHLSGHTLGTRSHHDLSLILQQSFSMSRVTLWEPGHTTISRSFFSIIFPSLVTLLEQVTPRSLISSFSNLFPSFGSHSGNQVTP